MPYQTGTFTSAADLRTTLETFATTNGWTNSGDVLHKGSVYVEVTNDTDWLNLLGGTGIDGGNNLTGADTVPRAINLATWTGETMTFPGTYHLISLSSPDNIFLAINYNVTRWQHLAFGSIRKYGTWGGGEYVSGSVAKPAGASMRDIAVCLLGTCTSTTSSGSKYLGGGYMLTGRQASGTGDFSYHTHGAASLFCDLDGTTWRNSAGVSYTGSGAGTTFVAAAECGRYLASLNTWNEQTVLAPVTVKASRTGSFMSVVGDMPHVRYLRIDNINDGEVITVGGQDWICFPHIKKDPQINIFPPSALVTTNHSSVLGWCIKYDGP